MSLNTFDSKATPVVGKVKLSRVYLNNGGYDRQGNYWGNGRPLWLVSWEDAEECHTDHIRAYERSEAMDIIRESLGDVSFYRTKKGIN